MMAELARAHLVGWTPECIAATRPRSVRYLVRRQAHASLRWTPLRGRDYGVRGTGERKARSGRMYELLAPPGWSWPPTTERTVPAVFGDFWRRAARLASPQPADYPDCLRNL